MKILVTYFSAEAGRTRKVAKDLALKLGADLFEIVPEQPYTEADLRYMNPLARCNREKFGKRKYRYPVRLNIFLNTTRCISVSRSGMGRRRTWLIHSARPMTGQGRSFTRLLHPADRESVRLPRS